MRLLPGGLLLLAVLSATLAGCDGTSRSEPRSSSPLRWGECPTEVEVEFITDHACGELTVPVDRNAASARAMTLRVLEAWGPAADRSAHQDVGFGVGGDMGMRMSTGGDLAAGVSRGDGAGVGIDFSPRGTTFGPSVSLACPEVDHLRTATVPDTDRSTRSAFVEGVRACAARLRSAGVEPADFDAQAMALLDTGADEVIERECQRLL